MKTIKEYKVILWDFDGVIMDSMPIRDKGFEEVLKQYPREQVNKLMEFHRKNGGLSRYVKFRYFFEEVRGEQISNEKVQQLADEFSEIMLSLLMNEKLLIEDSISFIKENHERHEMHIVSGSDEKELKKICDAINISQYFKSINGSPIHKNELVKMVVAKYSYQVDSVALIGDSVNDFEAAVNNNIFFFGYNNESLRAKASNYISQLSLLV